MAESFAPLDPRPQFKQQRLTFTKTTLSNIEAAYSTSIGKAVDKLEQVIIEDLTLSAKRKDFKQARTSLAFQDEVSTVHRSTI
jgi:hypothetical protein